MIESTDGFEVFVAVVEQGSISGAARALGVPRETLSRQLARLEERVGVRLLHRTSRTMTLTPAGERLLQTARPLVTAAREALADLRQLDDTPRGLLRISAPPGGGGAFLGEVCSSYLRKYPHVRLEVFAANRYVDLRTEGFDVALRAGSTLDPGLVARRLWASDILAVASTNYLEQNGVPQSLDALSAHACLLGMGGGAQPLRRWPTLDGGAVLVDGRLVSNDLGVLVASAYLGDGIAMIPRPFALPGLTSGALRPVLPELLGAKTAMSLVFLERRFLSPKTRAFIDHVVEWFEAKGARLSLEQALRPALEPIR